MIILAGIMTLMTFISAFFLYSLTQTLIMEFHQDESCSGTMTYLDVDISYMAQVFFTLGWGLLVCVCVQLL